MPESVPSAGYVLGALAVMFVVTVALRAAPFLALSALKNSAFVDFLGRTMPAGVMVILVMYTLRDVGESTWLPATVGLAGTIAVHLWRRNAALSTVVGTGLYLVASAFWT
ncbi:MULTISPECIES: branched-chain amino acid transporter permease [Rhodococcus]|uniref:Branched-chain amino acid permease n=1 Tax=Rhodococcus pyridinivorans AK37 TaxID=1114960 RepID=H0JU65_9NOCA|nr:MULTISPECIES: AzlD domain-containing protein [Rhodococcus]AOD21069.1 branched-chain amino acid ABC transporter [Rhodococcus sp. p52]AWZ22945.1 branched-chain amino acid ABC transporter [Rhodococcus pyridinivorans]EHK82384.1 branched-chain amino acid permease [Rhodococcus pyridinivorans AK37]KHJ74011.1 branched-chain amino acid ABC transporter [Rhodococcus sp. Chr-9]MBX4171372.1 AzlD domain-containing protein [Rhodococcus sp. DMU2021]